MQVITHASRDIDLEHTSWSELKLLNKFLETKNINSRLASVDDILSDCSVQSDIESTGSIIISIAGQLDNSLQQYLNSNSHIKVYMIIQDPNWQVSYNLTNNVTIVSPFKIVNSLSVSDAYNDIYKNLLGFNISEPNDIIYFPFGYMQLYTGSKQLQNNNRLDKSCYIGSLKEDRIHELYLLATSGVDFYGNFTKADFIDLIEKHGYNQYAIHYDTQFLGKLKVSEVVDTMSKYNYVAFIPDEKMLKLQSTYVRLSEMYLADSEIITLGSNKCDADVSLLEHGGVITSSLLPRRYVFNQLDTSSINLMNFDLAADNHLHHTTNFIDLLTGGE